MTISSRTPGILNKIDEVVKKNTLIDEPIKG